MGDVAKKDKSEGSIEALKENEEVEVQIEQKTVGEAEVEPDDHHPEAKEESKEEADEDEKEICDKETEEDKLDNEDTKDGKAAADSFVNDIYTTEGKREPCDAETKEEINAADSFINEIYTCEGKQEEDKEKESQAEKGIFKLKRDLEAEKEKDETNKEKAADSFVNDIYTTEGKQEPCDAETKEEINAADSFIN